MLIVSNKQFRAEAVIFTLIYVKIIFFLYLHIYFKKLLIYYSYILHMNINIFFHSFDEVVKFNVSIELNVVKVVKNYIIDVV